MPMKYVETSPASGVNYQTLQQWGNRHAALPFSIAKYVFGGRCAECCISRWSSASCRNAYREASGVLDETVSSRRLNASLPQKAGIMIETQTG